MKKIFLMLFAICAFAACDPIHEKIGNASHISLEELKAKTTVTVDKAASGLNGNVITCSTSAQVNAKWNIGGKDFVSNFATRKMKLGEHTVLLTAVCADGTVLTAEYPVSCQEITDPLQKFYIYGGDPVAEPPFQPGAWQSPDMRFSSTEGAHLPTISDDVYFGLKTLIVDVSDATPDCNVMVHNGWWSNTYISDWAVVSGLNELQITETMAKECAKGGDGKDLQLLLKSGSFTLNSVYYEE
jgi:hypothetical protein